MKAKKLSMVIVMFVIGSFMIIPVSYAYPVVWSSGGVTIKKLGNDGFPDFDWDIVSLQGSVGSFDLNGSFTDVINGLTFEAGPSSYGFPTVAFFITRELTVNGITLSITNPAFLAIGYSDTLWVYDGQPVNFGGINVTPLGWGDRTMVNGGGGTV